MSASPIARLVSENKAIPKRIYINDASEINGSYSSTPGGTLYSTTPGGTRIVYEKSMLMDLRNSPISKTPPKLEIPYHLQKGTPRKPAPPKKSKLIKNNINNNRGAGDDNEQFPLEI